MKNIVITGVSTGIGYSSAKTLIDNGYLQKEVVRYRGEFSLRGSVVDFFSSNLSYPARIELLGNNVESIRLFNPETQLTTKKVKSLSTLPVFEYPLNRESISSFIKNTNLHLKNPSSITFWLGPWPGFFKKGLIIFLNGVSTTRPIKM